MDATKKFRLFERLRGFTGAREGHVIITFAFALLPMIGFVGAAVDFSRASAARTALQSASDATALMLSKTASTMSASELQTKATAYFNALYTIPGSSNTQVTAVYSTGGGAQVKVDAKSTLTTYFVKVLGVPSMNINTTTTTKWGTGKLRVALALDVTGSMSSSGKMTALKKAAKNLITTLEGAVESPGDIYISIIPFNKDVNVGSSNKNANWVDFDDHSGYDGWDSVNGSCSKSIPYNQSETKDNCLAIKKAVWTPDSHSKWNGCVTDRDQDHDTMNTAPTPSNTATLFPAEQFGSCPAQMMGQTYNWDSLRSKIDSFSPEGNTNQGIGLAWAWMSLTDGNPMNPPAITDVANTSKVIILMSDGLNTENRFSTSASKIDARQATLCTNIKADKITLYTIQVNTGGDPTSTVLKNCASDNNKFFLLTSADALISAFDAIGTTLSQLRIAK